MFAPYVGLFMTRHPDSGVAPGTKWEDVPENFTCPLCGVGKDMFEAE